MAAFQKRIEELKAYKEEHGHLQVKESDDKSLYRFCIKSRQARRGKGNHKLNKERIAALDDLGFDWTVRERSPPKAPKSFEERLEELTAHNVKHGHVNVKRSEDGSLHKFCDNIRRARRGKGSHKLTEERIASLDALGFKWGMGRAQTKKAKSFQERLEELTAYKADQGHLNVKANENRSLYDFCVGIRRARKNPGLAGGMKLTVERIAALNAIGFDWEPQKIKSFQERIEDLMAYQAAHGHLNVKEENEDKSLAQFCYNIRKARRGIGSHKLTEERIALLDDLGFDWEPTMKKQQRKEGSQRKKATEKREKKSPPEKPDFPSAAFGDTNQERLLQEESAETWKKRAEAAEKRAADAERNVVDTLQYQRALEDRLCCPVCYHDKEEMYLLGCGHRVCWDCFWQLKSGRCHTCRKQTKSTRLKRIYC